LEGTLESLIASYSLSDSKLSCKQQRESIKLAARPKSLQGFTTMTDVQAFGCGSGGAFDTQTIGAVAAATVSAEIGSCSRSKAKDELNHNGDMKKVFDIFRDNDGPSDLREGHFRHFLPIATAKSGLKFCPVDTSSVNVPSVVTYPENLLEEPLRRILIQKKPHFESTNIPDEYDTPSSSPGAWPNPEQVTKSPAYPLRAPTNIFPVEGNFACELTKHKHWTEEEDEQLRVAVHRETAHGERHDWKRIAKTYFGNARAGTQCKVRWKNHLKPGITRGQWKVHEDETILFMVQQGYKWAEIAHRLPGRIGENVRERYVNFLDPSLKKTPWTEEEDTVLFENQAILGNSWSAIRKLLPGRSENAIKNRYHNRKNAHLRKLKREADEREMREAGFIAPWDSAEI
jgi:hypothetical protein